MSRIPLKLAIPVFALIATFVCASSIGQPTKRGTAADPTPQAAVPNGKYYALVIGINAYPAPMPSLKTAENDAQAIAQTLSDNYGFDVKLLLGANATRNNILAAVNRYEDTLQPNDNLLIYYAGHGYENQATGKAYWLPADADSTFSPNRIIADDITTEMATIPARHILIISDSCYSGGLTREAPTASHLGAQNGAFLQRMMNSRSRTLMASGGDEPVSDAGPGSHSIFAYALLQAFAAEDQPVFSASDLFYTGVRQRVAGSAAQLPQYAIIRNSNHDDGDFVFTRKGTTLLTYNAELNTTQLPQQSETALWDAIEASRDKADFETYLNQYPNGSFAASAKQHIRIIEEGAQQDASMQKQAKTRELFWVDTGNGLMWARPDLNSQDSIRVINFPDASSYCARLNVLGHTGWRIPSEGELATFVQNQGKMDEYLQMVPPARSINAYQDFWTATPGKKSGEHLLLPFEGGPRSEKDQSKSGLYWSAHAICVRALP